MKGCCTCLSLPRLQFSCFEISKTPLCNPAAIGLFGIAPVSRNLKGQQLLFRKLRGRGRQEQRDRSEQKPLAMAMHMMISSLAVYMLSVSNHRIDGSPRLFRGEA